MSRWRVLFADYPCSQFPEAIPSPPRPFISRISFPSLPTVVLFARNFFFLLNDVFKFLLLLHRHTLTHIHCITMCEWAQGFISYETTHLTFITCDTCYMMKHLHTHLYNNIMNIRLNLECRDHESSVPWPSNCLVRALFSDARCMDPREALNTWSQEIKRVWRI